MPRDLYLNFFQIQGAEFVCIPCRFTNGRLKYKLCIIYKSTDNFSRLTIDYHVISMDSNIAEAKRDAIRFIQQYDIT